MKQLITIQSDNRASLITAFYGYMSVLTLASAGLMMFANYIFSPIVLTLSHVSCYLVDRPFHGGQLLGLACLLIFMIDVVAILLSRLNVAYHWISLMWVVLINALIGAMFSISVSAIACSYAIPAISFGFCALYALLTRQNLARWHNLVLFSLLNVAFYGGYIVFCLPFYFKNIPWKAASKLSIDLIIRHQARVLPMLFQSIELLVTFVIVPSVIMILVIMLTAHEVARLEKELEQNIGQSSINVINARAFFLFFKLYYFARYGLVKILFALFGLSVDKEA